MQGSPTFLTGPTGLALLATATQAEALAAIGAMANTAPEITTNANGTAYRWPNGLQICTGRVQQPANATNGVIATFPAVFAANPILVPIAEAAASGGTSGFISTEYVPISSSQSRLKVLSVDPTTIGVITVAIWIGYIAMGSYTP